MKIERLYGEVFNLYGDLQNIEYLRACCPEIEIIDTDLKSKPRFLDEKIDLVYIASTTEKGLAWGIEALKPYTEAIKEKIKEGQHFLVTGNAMDMFLEKIESDWDDDILGLNILPGKVRYTMLQRHNSYFVGEFEDMTIVGFKALFGFIYDSDDQYGWIKTTKGYGRNPQSETEGYKINNFYATTLIGPLLILNPDLCKWLLKEFDLPESLAFEEAMHDSYQARLKEFQEAKGFLYK